MRSRIGAKKFDRYSLPIWPALDMLAAVGLAALAGWLLARVRRGARRLEMRAAPALGALALAALLLGYDMTYQPYYLSYFNPLLGGGPVAQESAAGGLGRGP